jgi:hypothetical protein
MYCFILLEIRPLPLPSRSCIKRDLKIEYTYNMKLENK